MNPDLIEEFDRWLNDQIHQADIMFDDEDSSFEDQEYFAGKRIAFQEARTYFEKLFGVGHDAVAH